MASVYSKRSAALWRWGAVVGVILVVMAMLDIGAGQSPFGAPTSDGNDENDAISHPSIRLPVFQNGLQVKFKIKAYNGCFKWESTNENLVFVEPIENKTDDCATHVSEAYVVVAPGAEKNRTCWVYARDSNSTLSTEVFLDEVVNITLFTTTRMMYRDELSFITVQGFDAEGNNFNTLAGIPFIWNFKDSSNVLEFVKFAGTQLEAPSPIILDMESRNLESYVRIVKGVRTGEAQVRARIKDLPIAADYVTLIVREKIRIQPEEIFVMPGTKIQYKLQWGNKENLFKDIQLPNSTYTWSIENEEIVSISQDGILHAKKLGSSKVVVHAQYSTPIFAKVNVVDPASIGFHLIYPNGKDVFNGNAWYIIKELLHNVRIYLYDNNRNKIYYEGHDMAATFPDEYFSKQLVQYNEYRIRGLKQGTTKIAARLHHSGREISGTQQIFVILPLVINPRPLIILPWDTYYASKHQFTLIVAGGSGAQHWSVADKDNAVSVNSNGVVTVQTEGKATVTARDARCPANSDSVTVIVTPPATLFFEKQRMEVEVGSSIDIFASMKDVNGRSFHNCDLLKINWHIDDPTVFAFSAQDNVLPRSSSSSCSTRNLVALKEGSSVIRATYGPKDQLYAEIRIFAYNGIRVLHPNETRREYALVTLGTSARLVFEGGPNPWHLDQSGYFGNIAINDENQQTAAGGISVSDAKDNVLVTKVSGGRKHTFFVTCLRHATTVLTLTVGNTPTPSNPYPATATTTLSFVCSIPHHLLVFPKRQLSLPTKAWTELMASCDGGIFPTVEIAKEITLNIPTLYRVKNDLHFDVGLLVLDEERRPYFNFSSLAFDWSLQQNKPLARIDGNDNIVKSVQLLNKRGDFQLLVQSTYFLKQYLTQTRYERANPSLKRTIDFKLLEDVKVDPSDVRLYLHKKNTARIQASSGSGHYRFSRPQIANFLGDPESAFVDLVPVVEGVEQISVTDFCLEGSTPAKVTLKVVDISRIELSIVSKFLQVGNEAELLVTVFDSQDQPLDLDQLSFLAFEHFISNEFVEILKKPGESHKYIVKGKSVGAASITFSTVKHNGATITSKALLVTVFQPFRLEPRELILIPGCTFQVQAIDGPQPAYTTYQISKSSIASVDSTGLVKGIAVGRTILFAEMTTIDPLSGEKFSVGNDSIEVEIRQLSDIRIFAPTTRLLAGEEIVLRVAGDRQETPFTFGSCDIKFKWEVVNEDVLGLVPIYDSAKVTLEAESGFSVRVQGKSAGRTRVSVRVINTLNAFRRQEVESFLELQVIHPLQLIAPVHCNNKMLLLPSSQMKIKTNKEDNKLKFSTTSDIIAVDQRGVITTTNLQGGAIVLITDNEEFFPLPSLAIHVTVKHPKVLKLIPSSPFSDIPIDQALTIQLILADDLGVTFDSYDGIDFDYQTNFANGNIVSVHINKATRTLSVTAQQPGDVILRVFVKGYEGIDDYILLKVGSVITPNLRLVHLGATQKYVIHKKHEELVPGVWKTSDYSVLSIDEYTGEAKAEKIGKATISHSSKPFASVTVEVVEVDKVEIPERFTVSNEKGPQEYQVSLTFYAKGHKLVNKLGEVDHHISFECSILESEYASAIQSDSGDSCIVVPKSPKQLLKTTRPSHWPSTLTLLVCYHDQKASYRHTEKLPLRFAPAFASSLEGSHITLTPEDSQLYFVVHSNKPGSIVASSDSPKLLVRRLERTADAVSFELIVEDQSHEFDNAPLVISSLETNQREQYQISFKLKKSSSPNHSKSEPSYDYDDEGEEVSFLNDEVVNLIILLAVAGLLFYLNLPVVAAVIVSAYAAFHLLRGFFA